METRMGLTKYVVASLHHIVFRGMLQGMRREALKIAAGPKSHGLEEKT
jgi:hypothetical protein